MGIETTAPYAPAKSVVRILETYRDTGLGGGVIDAGLLARMGFGEEIARRCLQALTILGLLDGDGRPTASLTAFKAAPSDAYKQILADVLFDVYAPVFDVTGKDLGSKSKAQVEDAFRTFKPDSLRKRMVTMFLGLCEYAGIVEAAPKAKPGPKAGSPATARPAKKPKEKNEQHRQDPPPDDSPPVSGAREKYLDLLLAKAAAADEPDADLLDRIERALGITPKAGGSSP